MDRIFFGDIDFTFLTNLCTFVLIVCSSLMWDCPPVYVFIKPFILKMLLIAIILHDHQQCRTYHMDRSGKYPKSPAGLKKNWENLILRKNFTILMVKIIILTKFVIFIKFCFFKLGPIWLKNPSRTFRPVRYWIIDYFMILWC